MCGAVSRFTFSKTSRDFFACDGCGLHFIYPLPSLEEIAALYDRDYYDSWGLDSGTVSTERMKQATFHDKLDVVEKFVPDKGRILDIGCATGFFLDAARQREWDPYGVELSSYSSELARQLIGSDRILTGQLADAEFADNSFDAVFMTDVIEHVHDVRPFIAEVSRITRAGGIVAITTPDPESLSCRLMGRHWPHFKLEHLLYFSARSLSLLMEPMGFINLYAGSATKTLTFAYLDLQMRTYPVPLATPLVSLLARLLPAPVLHSMFKIPSGELFQVFRMGGKVP